MKNLCYCIPRQTLRIRKEDNGLAIVSKIDTGQVIVLNKTAVEILELCDGTKDLEDIAAQLLNKYKGVTKEEITSSIIASINQLEQMGFVVRETNCKTRVDI